MKNKSTSYLSLFAGVLLLMGFLLTGCAKDEAILPLSEDETFRAMETFDSRAMEAVDMHSDVLDSRSGDSDDDPGDITDDEDDEDDTNRTTNR